MVTVHLGFKCDSALLKHELAYCLGQIGSEEALPVLETVLGDMNEDPMVRHEVRSCVRTPQEVSSSSYLISGGD